MRLRENRNGNERGANIRERNGNYIKRHISRSSSMNNKGQVQILLIIPEYLVRNA